MAARRAAMRKTREILRLLWDGRLGVRQIARTCAVSHSTVLEYRLRAATAGLCWEEVASMDSARLEQRLFPAVASPSQRAVPDWDEIHLALKGKSVTLQLLWEEYRAVESEGYQYSQFCKLYGDWRGRLDLSMRQQHRAGEKLFVDYCGDTVPVNDAAGDALRQAVIFVAVQGASSCTYAEATWSQSLPDWIGSHVRAFAYFGGVTELLIPDNLKSGVTKACRYEPTLNRTYEDLARHYGTTVIPARVRRPKDKSKAEIGVQVVQRWILASLRRRQFFSLAELNAAIRELLERLNNRPFKKLPGSRRSQFETLDRPALRPLPEAAYEYAEWPRARVRHDYHVAVDGHFYSVPYQLVGKEVDVRLTASAVECLHGDQRVACHLRSAVAGGSTTCVDHMPPSHRGYAEQTPETLAAWAEKTGPATAQLVAAIVASRSHPQLGFRACLGLRTLGRSYGLERLENACRRALEIHAFSYKSVRSILQRGFDRYEPRAQPAPAKPIDHGNVRGAKYYQNAGRSEEVASC